MTKFILFLFVVIASPSIGQSQYQIDTEQNKKNITNTWLNRYHFVTDSLTNDSNKWINLGTSEVPHYQTQDHAYLSDRFKSKDKYLKYEVYLHKSGFIRSEIIEVSNKKKVIYKRETGFHKNGLVAFTKLWVLKGKRLKKSGNWKFYGPSGDLFKRFQFNSFNYLQSIKLVSLLQTF
tara:strand:+ start:95 stop:625 length:531 start_codon:yes stop_codon:yes gene_type:complete